MTNSAIDRAIQKLLDLTSSLDSPELRWGFDTSMNNDELTKQAKDILEPLIQQEQQTLLDSIRAEIETDFYLAQMGLTKRVVAIIDKHQSKEENK